MLNYRKLGASPLRVSELCLGAMMFGDQTDAKAAADIIALAREQGVNFVDTADVYTQGAAEHMLGALLKGDRQRWVLASKVGNAMSSAPNESRYSRKWMMQQIDASLRRLGTDFIDIYYLHRDFEDDSLDEPLRALDDMLRAGKIRAWGVSNFRGWRISEAVHLARAIGMAGPAVCQPYYNLLNRMPEVEVLPACAHYGLGVASYSPIARGVLTGKYQPDAMPPAGSRAARGDKRIAQTEFRVESLGIAQKLAEHAKSKGIDLLQFALAWVLANRTVSSVIAGPKTLAQWQQYFGALDYVWSREDESLVEGMVPTGHPSTPGFSDPSYPVTGRRVSV
jgi:aryl-alcohol dehydrogenase-like predicted oxidoreductase